MLESIQVGPVRVSPKNKNFLWCDETFPLFTDYEGKRAFLDHWDFYEQPLEEFKARRGPLLFESGDSWASYLVKKSSSFTLEQYFKNSQEPRQLQSLIEVFPEERRMVLYKRSDRPWGYPIDELFFLYAFSISQSLLIHGCALAYKGEGYLFCGVSGAGKTTLATLLEKEKDIEILCDERNVVNRDDKGQFWLSSTPWYGTGFYCVPKTLPLKKIIILDPSHQGAEINKIGEFAALEALMQVSFLPQFYPEGMKNCVDELSKLVQEKEVFTLSYDKERTELFSFLKETCFSSQS